jgi:hypothetical protein
VPAGEWGTPLSFLPWQTAESSIKAKMSHRQGTVEMKEDQGSTPAVGNSKEKIIEFIPFHSIHSSVPLTTRNEEEVNSSHHAQRFHFGHVTRWIMMLIK